MAQMVVREIEESVKQSIKRRAARHGHSMEEEIREILRRAAREEELPPVKLGSRIAARFKGNGLDEELPELRGREVKAAEFSE